MRRVSKTTIEDGYRFIGSKQIVLKYNVICLLKFKKKTHTKKTNKQKLEKMISFIFWLSLETWSKNMLNVPQFLAHLSRRLTRRAYSIVVEPVSIRTSVRASVHIFKLQYL